jgi:hypothetical protein
VSAFDDGRQQYSYVSIAELVRTQKLALGRLLRRLLPALRQIDLKKEVEIERRSDYRQSKPATVTPPPQPHRVPSKRAALPSRTHHLTPKESRPDRRQSERRKVQRPAVKDRRRVATRTHGNSTQQGRSHLLPPTRHFTPRATLNRQVPRRAA